MNIRYSLLVALTLLILLVSFPPKYIAYEVINQRGKVMSEFTKLEMWPIGYLDDRLFIMEPYAPIRYYQPTANLMSFGREKRYAFGDVLKGDRVAVLEFCGILLGIILTSALLGMLARRRKPLFPAFFITAGILITLVILIAPHSKLQPVFPKQNSEIDLSSLKTESVAEFKPVWIDLLQVKINYFVVALALSIILSALLGILSGQSGGATTDQQIESQKDQPLDG